MGDSTVNRCCTGTRFAIVVLAVVLLTACSGSSNDGGGNGGAGSNTPGPGDGGVGDAIPELTLDLGPDFTLSDTSSIVAVNAGRTLATRFLWELVSAGTEINLLNKDTSIVTFIAPKFSAATPLDARKLTLKLTVWDDFGQEASDEIVITVPPDLEPAPGSNNPPTINNLPDVIVHSGETVELTAVATDPEDGVPKIFWNQITGPILGLTEEEKHSDTVRFTAPPSPVKIWFIVQATDSDGQTEQTDVLISVVGNLPPTANAGGDVTAASGQLVTIQGSGGDSDGSVTQYLWRKLIGPDVSLINDNAASVSFTAPAVSVATDITLQLTVTDDKGATGTDEVVITVNPVLSNTPPTANAGADQIANPGAVVTLSGSGSDADGNISAYSWKQTDGPAVALSDPNNPAVTFTMPSDVQGLTDLVFRLTVTDDLGATASDEVLVTANQPPVANAGADVSVKEGDTVNLIGSDSSDPDGHIVSYHWARLSGEPLDNENAIVDPDSSTASFIAPAPADTGNVTLQLTVTDNHGATDTDTVVVTINPANIPPTADAGPDINVNSGAPGTLSITGQGNDTDGNVVSYNWTQTAGPAVALTGADTAKVSFTVPDVSVTTIITLRLTVGDDAGATAFDEVNVTVNAPRVNNPPIVNAGGNQTVQAGDTVTLTGNGTDPDGDSLSYQWVQIDGPSVNLNNDALPNAFFTAPQVNATATITLQLTVTDSNGASGSDQVIITVQPANLPPIANAGADQSVNAGQLVTLSGSGNDPDGSISAYLWTQISGPALTLNNADTANVSFTAPSVTTTTQITLRLTVTDNDGATAFDDVVIAVTGTGTGNGNAAPVANAGPDIDVLSGDNVSIAGTASDDGTIIVYIWTQTAGTPVLTLNDSATPTVSFIAPPVAAVTSVTLRLTVVDDLGAIASDDVVVTIHPSSANANVPPSANAGSDQVVNIFDQVNLQGLGIDVDGSIAGYQWVQTAGTPVSLSNTDSANASFSAPGVTRATEFSFDLTVTDDAGESATDTVLVTVHPLASISGTITAASGSQVDSDVNDSSAPYASNDSILDAQPLVNPVLLGGYVNLPGQGSIGRSTNSGDTDDYYAVSFSANQVVNLYIGDVAAGGNDLDLYLLDQNNQVIDASLSPGAATESLVVPAAGTYFINVKAVRGASNYVLSVGMAVGTFQSNGWRLSDDFQAGDVIVQFDDNSGTPPNFKSLANRASSVGLQPKAGAPGRNMLLGLGNAAQRVTAFNQLGVRAGTANVATGLQDKLDTLLTAKSLARRLDVKEVSLNYRYYPAAIPNDTRYNLQWHYPSINLPQAWDITTGSSDVIVAVIDTGVLLNHPDLQGQLVPGYDFIADNTNSGDGQPGIDSDPNDPGDGGGATASSFHGTHVSGTIAAASNNGSGVAGIAWGVKIMPCRAVGINGGLRYDIEQCVRFVSGLSNDSGTLPAQPADIINLSLGGPTNTTTAPSAYRNARAEGVIVIAAAGNNASNELFAPAAYNGVVSVSATNINRQLASYSNFGATIDVAAPGGDSGDFNGDGYFDGVLSTSGDDSSGSIIFNYRFAAGTSMAAPHMAGVAALMKSVYPGLTPDIFDTMLANGELTDDIGSPGRDNNYGYGIINAQKAVQAAANAAAPSPPPAPPAALQVSPTSLNFGFALTSAQINISNAGGGTLDVSGISDDAGGWLTVTPVAVDTAGLGAYDIIVNRTGLLDGVYTATITIVTSAGTQDVAVIMQVNGAGISHDAGFHYIELIDVETMQLFDRVISAGTNGVYEYSFPGVPFGLYHVRAGSDLDKDGVLCEVGDACGAYPTLDIVAQHIVVDSTTPSLTGLDFITEFRVNLTTP